MKPKSRIATTQKKGIAAWIPWIQAPKSLAERARDRRELANMRQEMEATVAGLSPEMQTEIRDLSDSKEPRAAERELLDYVVTDDHFTQLRKDSRRGDYKKEGSMRDGVYWIAMVPVLIVLYFIFSWLSSGHVSTH